MVYQSIFCLLTEGISLGYVSAAIPVLYVDPLGPWVFIVQYMYVYPEITRPRPNIPFSNENVFSDKKFLQYIMHK